MSKHTGLLFIGFVIVAAIIVVVFVNRDNEVIDTDEVVTNSTVINTNPTSVNADTAKIISPDGTYTLLKPAETTTNGEIITYRFLDGNSLSIMPQALQSLVLNETPIKEEADITVGALPAKRYTLASAKDGSLFPIVQVIYESKLYDFRGSEDYLGNLNSYITFTNNE